MKRVFCVVTLCLVSCASIAGTPFPFSDFGWDLSEKKIVDKTYLKLSGVLIGTTTLDEVVSILGTQSYTDRIIKTTHLNCCVINQKVMIQV